MTARYFHDDPQGAEPAREITADAVELRAAWKRIIASFGLDVPQLLWAATEVERLRLENANLREQLAGHYREAMMRAVVLHRIEGPCRLNEYSDPHNWVRIPKTDGAERCTRCGTVCSK